MKQFCALVFIAFLSVAYVYAKDADTLKYYRNQSSLVFYRHPDIIMQAARFQIASPCTLKQIHLSISGDKNGSALVHIFGHEGGLSAPMQEIDIIPPYKVHKTITGPETISIPLPPDIEINNDQFFVAVDQLSPGVHLLSDTESKKSACSSKEGGEYYYQFIKLSSGKWQYAVCAFMIECVVEYSKRQETAFYRDSLAVREANKSDYTPTIACADINKDGYIDVLANGQLYLNDKQGNFDDVTQKFGIQKASGHPRANAFIDINNDGKLDILFLGSYDSSSQSSAFLNSGDTVFIPLSLELPVIQNPTGFSIADINHDKYADIYINQSKTSPDDTLHSYLLINSKNMSFSDGNTLLSSPGNTQSGCSRSSSFVDFDNDSDADLFLSCVGQADELWKNNGNGTFTKLTTLFQQSPNHVGNGCNWADINNDGLMDLLSPQYSQPIREAALPGGIIYPNTGTVNRALRADNLGIDYEEKRSSGSWGDIDNDGKMDCIITTSCDCRYADVYLQKNNTFENNTMTYGLQGLAGNKDAIWVDVNNDGSLDLMLFDKGALTIYKQKSTDNHFVELDLESISANTSAIGTRVTLYTNGKTLTREIVSGRGLLMQDPLRLHFGLGNASTIDSLVVQWPINSQAKETFTNLTTDNINKVIEGQGSAHRSVQSSISDIKAYPNPFTNRVAISWYLSTPETTQLSIFTLAGTKIKELVDERLQAGEHRVQWDGSDNLGSPVSSGIYLYRLTSGDSEYIGTISLIE